MINTVVGIVSIYRNLCYCVNVLVPYVFSVLPKLRGVGESPRSREPEVISPVAPLGPRRRRG